MAFEVSHMPPLILEQPNKDNNIRIDTKIPPSLTYCCHDQE